jgi:hypothetical protein
MKKSGKKQENHFCGKKSDKKLRFKCALKIKDFEIFSKVACKLTKKTLAYDKIKSSSLQQGR